MTDAADDLERQTAAFEARLGALRRTRRHLALAKDEEDHQARRLKDALERQGGREAEAESQLSLLDEGRRLTAKALARADTEIEDLERRLAALGDGIDESTGG